MFAVLRAINIISKTILRFIFYDLLRNLSVSDEEKKRMGVVNSNDGTFWMELGDWIDEFEYLAICALPGLDVNDEDGDISEELVFFCVHFCQI